MKDRLHLAARAAAVAALALLVSLAGCRPFSGPLPGDPAPEPYFIQHLSGEGSFPLDIDLGDETRDVYLAFVNPAPGKLDTVTGSVTVSGSMVGDTAVPAARAVNRDTFVVPVTGPAPTPRHITEFNQTVLENRPRPAPSLRLLDRAPGPPSFDFEGQPGTFFNIDSSPFDAVCRRVVAKDPGNGIPRTLNIWVEKDCWYETPNPSNLKPFYVRDLPVDMIGALVAQFLAAGPDNDIYDWVTTMLGPEWGPHGYSDLIEPNDEITIVLCDIGNDESANGGVVGYYWEGDNYKTAYQPDSSQRVMFTIDAVMFANDCDALGLPGDLPGWNSTDYWPEEIFSTLAHEFQHMIHFYQRGVLRDAVSGGDTWINEMASQMVEDLIADKMGVMGPRGIDGSDPTSGAAGNVNGRLPLFDYYNDISLTQWGSDLPSYSITYAFGAWLARNYGGAMLLNRLMQCPTTGTRSIEDIVSAATGKPEYFPRILQRWSVAQILSNQTDTPPGYRYNISGWYISTVGTTQYRLGSIDLYNYDLKDQWGTLVQSGPWIYTSSNMASVFPPGSVALYRAATGVAGALDWTLTMPRGLIPTVLVK